MPQTGDGDLWPTTDDDTSSTRAKDAETHELPVPDQQKQPEKPKQAKAGWFDAPDEPADKDTPAPLNGKRDEPHAKPEQQITQPVSWPIADLERQIPAWPSAENNGTNQQSAATSFAPAARAAKNTESGEPEKDTTGDEETSVAAGQEDDAEPAHTDDVPQQEDSSDGRTEDESNTGEPDGEDASPPPDTEEDAPAEASREGNGQSVAWPEQARDDVQPDPPRQKDTRKEDAPTSFMRPVQPGGRKEDAPTSFMRPVQPGSRKEDAPTSFMRPLPPETGNPPSFRRSAPPEPGKTRQGSPPPSFIRPRQEDATTSFIRRKPEDPPSFTRNTDSTTVNLTRGDDWPPREPPRAAPKRVGTEPAEPEPQQKKSKKPLLITAIAVAAVVAVAAGVVFGVPGLSDKLGLTGEDPVAIAPPPAPVKYSPSLHGPDAATQGPTRQGVEQALAGPMSVPALGNVNGIVIDPVTGETLYEKNADGAITPASTGKILTAAAALLSLDLTEQLVTKVVEGDQPGEVIIVGGGDPTISSLEVGEESVYPGAAHLSELVDQVKAGGAQVQTVYIDQSRYAPPGLAPSWLPADVGAGYIAPIVPAMLDGDRQGDPTENYVRRTTDPGRTLVDAFANRIGASPADSIEKKAPENAKVLGEIRSAPITQLVDNMLNRSENTLGDVLAHEVAIKAGETPDFDGASKAMLDVLRENGFNVDGVVLRDGSGMSEENKVTAKLLAEVLAVAAGPDGKDPRTAKLRPLLGGLPVAGGSGTLADRYTEGAAAAGKGWVRAKTGSLTGINSLAGIVLDKDNRPLVFAFLTSGTVATSARPALDDVTAVLRGCGCQ